MRSPSRPRLVLTAAALALWLGPGHAAAQPRGELTYAMHVTITPSWFDPAENTGIATPFMVQEALHDALVKPMPANLMAPSLAASWTESSDGLRYEFVLRRGVTFHDGDPLTADDVKFSFERYRGAAAKLLRDKVKAVEIVAPQRIRFVLHEPWPDFLTFYATPATGAAWIVPKKYVERVGEAGFKKQPIGAGPYKFVSHQPGVELVLEAYDKYWRKAPSVKRLVMKVVPEEPTRLAMLKNGEADIAYLMTGPVAEEIKRTPTLRLIPSGGQWVTAVCMLDQADPRSPWHDARVRLAASHAIDRKAIADADSLGASPPMGSMIPPATEFALPVEPPAYDPAKARHLLREAGYPNGFDAGEMVGTVQFSNAAEAVINYFAAVGIRSRLRTMERVAYLTAWKDKKLKGLLFCGAGGYGNAATRVENYFVSGGTYAAGGHPDIDDLFQQQARELDRVKRQALLQRIQRLAHERVLFLPVYALFFNNGVGPRVQESSLGRIPLHYYTAPFEDVRLKGN
ncbi:MAG TPA: ABC transporter substrate-binding protein [Patescibacteria group bacterium]|nr:ABC transporter substrate-binding protein [Patescibacteria group bacterium]